MNVREIRQMTDVDILDEIEDLKSALFNLRLEDVSGQVENTNVFRQHKRDIARLKTVLRERQFAAAMASEEKDAE